MPAHPTLHATTEESYSAFERELDEIANGGDMRRFVKQRKNGTL